MYLGRGVCVLSLVAGVILGTVGSAWSQSNDYVGGRIVRSDERSEELQMGSVYDDEALTEEEAEQGGNLPWIPVLSPTMICLDCWMTKTYKIWDFYHQQAAQEYFAHSESCADLVLCPDPCVGSAFKYTLLAPIYAMRPHLLLRNCSACGISNPYGVPDPMPSVAVDTQSGPQVLSTAPSADDIPAVMPEAAPLAPEVPAIPATQSMGNGTQSASASKWANMSDQEILAHFNLTPGAAQGQTAALDSPTAPSTEWEFADTAPSTPAAELIASMAPPAPIAPLASETKSETSKTASDSEKTSAKKTTQQKAFSVTDKEYDRMREIEKGLLAGSDR